MTDPPHLPGTGPDHEPNGIPAWAKVTGIVLIIVLLLAIVVMLIDGGTGHTPRRHAAAGDPTVRLWSGAGSGGGAA